MSPRETPEGGWDSLKVDELREELEARGLPKSGKKDELVARLESGEAGGEAEEGATEEVAGSEATGQPVAEEVIPRRSRPRSPAPTRSPRTRRRRARARPPRSRRQPSAAVARPRPLPNSSPGAARRPTAPTGR